MSQLRDGDNFDCSMEIGPLVARSRKPKWPMYSYDRPAYVVWNAIGNVLLKRGWTDEEIMDWLQSKYPRWALDGALGEALEEAATNYAKRQIKDGEKA